MIAAGVVDGIACARDERVVTGIDEGGEQVGDALLAADEREDFLVGVDVDVEAVLHPLRAGLAVAGCAEVAGILVIRGVVDGLAHRLDDVLGRGRVGVADAQRDDVDALCLLRRLLAVDLGEQVRRQIVDALGGPHG